MVTESEVMVTKWRPIRTRFHFGDPYRIFPMTIVITPFASAEGE